MENSKPAGRTDRFKIAIVHDFLTKLGGAENVLLAMHDLFPDAPIYTLLYDEEGTRSKLKNCEIHTSSLQKRPAFLRKRPKFLFAKFSQAIEEFDFSEYDIVISSSNSFAHGIITKPKTFHLSYCYSPMRYVWDWTNEYLEENNVGMGIKGIYIRNIIHKNRIWDKVASDRVDQWVAISKTVQERINKYYHADSKVVYSPANVEKIEMAKGEPDDYFVIVSRLEPYKKIELAIEAFNKMNKQLIIIGVGSELSTLKKQAGSTVEFLGWQSDESVYEYLRNAKALIFPGEEDYGLTPIEAMACGRPVVAYSKGGVTETVVSGKTGVFFDEQTPESLISAVEKLESSYSNFYPDACRYQAEKFSVAKFNESFLSTLDQAHANYLETMSQIDKK